MGRSTHEYCQQASQTSGGVGVLSPAGILAAAAPTVVASGRCRQMREPLDRHPHPPCCSRLIWCPEPRCRSARWLHCRARISWSGWELRSALARGRGAAAAGAPPPRLLQAQPPAPVAPAHARARWTFWTALHHAGELCQLEVTGQATLQAAAPVGLGQEAQAQFACQC